MAKPKFNLGKSEALTKFKLGKKMVVPASQTEKAGRANATGLTTHN